MTAIHGLTRDAPVGVIGAGTMGAGIVQVAAAAGHRVFLFDVAPGAAAAGKAKLIKGLGSLVDKGRMTSGDVDAISSRIEIAEGLADLAETRLVIEAIVERLDVKRAVFSDLEAIVAEDAILATNTSSISVTAIAATLKKPARLVGMHFFNPAPVMKLVEVVSGISTAPEVANAIHATATNWGKVAVHTKSTPGFVVNRVARGFYGEALRLLEENVASPATIDALMTEAGGFRMGPFALMDLIGHDVNYAVSKSVFDAYHQEPRFRPSIVQQELVDAGCMGRKSGRGFYDYSAGARKPAPLTSDIKAEAELWSPLKLDGYRELRDRIIIAGSDGRTAHMRSAAGEGAVVVYDLFEPYDGTRRLAFARSADVTDKQIDSLVATLGSQGIAATELPDWPGLVVLRILSTIVNEAFEAAMQGVADEDSIDLAMRFGVNYPHGPVAWARRLGLGRVLAVLDTLHDLTGDMRYRASYRLRSAAVAR